MKAIIPFLLLASCGEPFCENPDFEVAGLKICTDDPVDPEEIEIVVRVTEEKTKKIYSYSPIPSNTFEDYRRSDIRIQFINEALVADCKKLEGGMYRCEKSVSGMMMTQGSDMYRVYVRYIKCLANTSLSHEMLHVLEDLYLGGPQGENGHSAPYMFQQDAKKQGILIQDTIELKIYEETKPLLKSCQGS